MFNCLDINWDRMENKVAKVSEEKRINPSDLYCIMCSDTLKHLQRIESNYIYIKSEHFTRVLGAKIAICNELSLGEIDIR